MSQPIYLVDAFAHEPFTGNPAAVCPMQAEPDEQWMQRVATEMNQAETAFFWPEGGAYRLRWFTPAVEVDLCGHATLASAHVLFTNGGGEVRFQTRSGELVCNKTENGIAMDFPNEAPDEVGPFPVVEALGVQPVWMGANRMDWFFVLESEEDVLQCKPDFRKVADLGKRGVIVTAQTNGSRAPSPQPSPKGEGVRTDFLSRFFAPQSGIDEDPVTGSAHCALGPFWSQRLGKPKVTGYQASKRGGYVTIETKDARVTLSGQARTVLCAELRI